MVTMADIPVMYQLCTDGCMQAHKLANGLFLSSMAAPVNAAKQKWAIDTLSDF